MPEGHPPLAHTGIIPASPLKHLRLLVPDSNVLWGPADDKHTGLQQQGIHAIWIVKECAGPRWDDREQIGTHLFTALWRIVTLGSYATISPPAASLVKKLCESVWPVGVRWEQTIQDAHV